MKTFEIPVVEIQFIQLEDVITTSVFECTEEQACPTKSPWG